jgi:hypothetical protein
MTAKVTVVRLVPVTLIEPTEKALPASVIVAPVCPLAVTIWAGKTALIP